MPIASSSSRRAASSKWGRTRSWSGGAATMPLWCIGNIAASYLRMMLRAGALHRLPRLPETFLELRELSGDCGVVLVGQRELRYELHRALISETGAVEVPALLLAVSQARRMEVPADHGHLRPEIFEALEFLQIGRAHV